MEKLMSIDSDYWNTFLGKDEGEDLYRDSRWVDESIRVKLCVLSSMLCVMWYIPSEKIGQNF